MPKSRTVRVVRTLPAVQFRANKKPWPPHVYETSDLSDPKLLDEEKTGLGRIRLAEANAQVTRLWRAGVVYYFWEHVKGDAYELWDGAWIVDECEVWGDTQFRAKFKVIP